MGSGMKEKDWMVRDKNAWSRGKWMNIWKGAHSLKTFILVGNPCWRAATTEEK